MCTLSELHEILVMCGLRYGLFLTPVDFLIYMHILRNLKVKKLEVGASFDLS